MTVRLLDRGSYTRVLSPDGRHRKQVRLFSMNVYKVDDFATIRDTEKCSLKSCGNDAVHTLESDIFALSNEFAKPLKGLLEEDTSKLCIFACRDHVLYITKMILVSLEKEISEWLEQ